MQKQERLRRKSRTRESLNVRKEQPTSQFDPEFGPVPHFLLSSGRFEGSLSLMADLLHYFCLKKGFKENLYIISSTEWFLLDHLTI